MNTTIFWRLAWKEYRQQRELIIAIAIITFVILGIMLAWSWVENQAVSPATAYHLALMMPVFYALGCGATLFAGEHERDTFAFLRALPLRSHDAFWPKFAIGVCSTLVLTAVLLLMTTLFTFGRFALRADDLQLLGYYFLIMSEVLVWTMLFSQLLKHPFWAIAVAGIAYLTSVVAVVAPLGMVFTTPETQLVAFTIARSALVIVLAGVNIALGTKWLERDRVLATSQAAPTSEAVASAKWPATRWTMLGRLWWQSLRESGWIFAIVYGALTLLSVLIFLDQGPPGMVWGCLPVLIGSFTFFQDHWKQQYRFFSERGISARMLWWARILASLTVCLPWLVVLLITMATQSPQAPQSNGGLFGDGRIFQWPADMLLLAVLCFAWGQWCSLVIRSGMLGLFIGVVASFFFPFALAILRALGIPDWLGVYIPSALLLWASWRRAPDWLAERNSWRRWFAYSATLAVPLVMLLAGMAAHRAYEIPQLVDNSSFVSGPGGVNIPAGIAAQHAAALAELQRPATAEELETAKLYRDLWNELRQLPPPNGPIGSMMGSAPQAPLEPIEAGSSAGTPNDAGSAEPAADPPPVDKEWEAKLAGLVDRFVETSRRPDAFFEHDPYKTWYAADGEMIRGLERAVIYDARRLDGAGEFEAGLERHLALVRFARHYQQRGYDLQISMARGLVSKVYESLLSRAARIDQSEESLLSMSRTLSAPPYDFVPNYEVAWLRDYAWRSAIVDLDPAAWDWVATGGANRTVEARRRLALVRCLPWEQTRMRRLLDYTSVVPFADQRASPVTLLWRTNTLWAQELGFFNFEESRRSWQIMHDVHRAAFQLRVLLLAWKQEHGELPESLEELEKAFPGKVPLDPATHGPWVYRPQGVRGEERLESPFIWSPGHSVATFGAIPPEDVLHLVTRGTVFTVEPSETND